ncbi:MAG TPA: exopolysaccharide Pel transporter PelG [Burkholderiales bacterium]|nr:exopolysaccharide Pel transporter PelG [Burkholderiales bacterium]
MAGIGFELRKLLRTQTYSGLLRAYAYAGIISSGPWVLSIIGIQVVGVLSLSVVVPDMLITRFQVTVTYLIACSLIATGALQLGFTRYLSDQLFLGNERRVVPNLNGALLVTMLSSGALALAAALLVFPEASNLYRALLVCGFVVLSCVWIVTIMLSGLKQYKAIVVIYALGYGVAVGGALALRPLGTEGLLLGFVGGQFVLLAAMLALVYRSYPADGFVTFDFMRRGAMYPSLLLIGLLYNVGIWADKLLFWYFPSTSEVIIGPLRASPIYDTPIFLAYLAIIPGMAVFLVRMETDFAEYYQRFYDAVRSGGSLGQIERMRDEMVFTVRQGLFEIIKVQTLAVLVVFETAAVVLRWLGISDIYLPLLFVDVVAVGLQVLLLGVLNVLFYLDKRAVALQVTAIFAGCNLLFTAASLALGASWYGYGFALALLAAVVWGAWRLNGKLNALEYETFMLQ